MPVPVYNDTEKTLILNDLAAKRLSTGPKEGGGAGRGGLEFKNENLFSSAWDLSM